MAALLWAQVSALEAAAAFAGISLFISSVDHPYRASQEPKEQLKSFRWMYPIAAAIQAPMALIATVSGAVAFELSGLNFRTAWPSVVGSAAFAGILGLTLLKIRPINNALLDPQTDAVKSAGTENAVSDLITQWGTYHHVRTALSIVGLTMFFGSIVAHTFKKVTNVSIH